MTFSRSSALMAMLVDFFYTTAKINKTPLIICTRSSAVMARPSDDIQQ
jgi:hypothetical protein